MQAANIVARIIAYAIGYQGQKLWIALTVIGIGCIPLGAISIAQTAVFCDSIDYMEWKTGKRTEGVTFSMQTMFTKISSGITAGLAALALHLLKYKWIWPLVILTPAIASLLYIIPLLFIRYTPAEREKVESELAERRAAAEQSKCAPSVSE